MCSVICSNLRSRLGETLIIKGQIEGKGQRGKPEKYEKNGKCTALVLMEIQSFIQEKKCNCVQSIMKVLHRKNSIAVYNWNSTKALSENSLKA